MKTTIKTFTCKIEERWYTSLEGAWLSITTPKGTTLTIWKLPKAYYENKWDSGEGKTPISILVWKVYNSHQSGTIELTKEEVLLWKSFSDKQDKFTFIPISKPSNVNYVIPLKKKLNDNSEVCSCGATHNIKRHKGWVGYSCPKCGEGGSYSTKK
jgi:predicted RNA-binding Zn-ribbon protein involved in translation (DUF1610 family)